MAETAFSLADLPRLVAAIPPAALHAQRWFGGKGAPWQSVSVLDACLVPGIANAALVLAEVTFQTGETHCYFLPLVLHEAAATSDRLEGVLARVEHSCKPCVLQDGLMHTELCRELLRLLYRAVTLPGQAGRFVCQSFGDLPALVGPLEEILPKAVYRVQGNSNSALLLGEHAFLKCFRRVTRGTSPDAESVAFLTTQTTFRNVPPLAGSLSYFAGANPPWTLAMLQPRLRGEGELWSVLRDRLPVYWLRRTDSPREPGAELCAKMLPNLRLLGQRTGELHLALASRPDIAGFAPEPMTTSAWQAWAADLTKEFTATQDLLRARWGQLPGEQVELAQTLAASDGTLAQAVYTLVRALTPVTGTPAAGLDRIRIHGDYHLGQVFQTESDFMIMDFEGEPTRPPHERRAKQLAVKDVAGMLRSFNYAGFAAVLQGRPGPILPDLDRARQEWEQQARAEFVEGYSEAIRSASSKLWPRTAVERQLLLDAFELEKALYELRYELNHRPDWVWIPLRGIQQILNTRRS